MNESKLAARVALRHVTAGALEDVSKLRFQAVFMMGAGGSGKGFVGRKWMKYMPGGGSKGIDFDDPNQKNLAKRRLTEMERGQTNITFEKAKEALARDYNLRIVPVPGGSAKTPFFLTTHDDVVIPEKDWKKELPPEVYEQVKGLKEVVFAAPKYEIPSFWRQVDPDLYKKELAGYSEKQPGYVHEMSSLMSKAYFEAILETGDPLFVDGTGTKADKMTDWIKKAEAAGYRTSVVFVAVPLVVNQIRNATRSRNVHPNIVTGQWKRIPEVYNQIKGLADKAKVIVNRADSMDVSSYRANADHINNFIAKNTSFDSLYDLIEKEAPNELREWGKILKLHAGEAEKERRFERLEEKRKERGGAPRQYVRSPRLPERLASELAEALRDFQAHVDKTGAIVTVRDRCKVTLTIDKIVPYGEPRPIGEGLTEYHFHLIGSLHSDPSFGFPVKFKAHAAMTEEGGSFELLAIHTDRSGKVMPKIMGDYVKSLLHKYQDSWIGSLPV